MNPYESNCWSAPELIDELVVARLRQQRFAGERDFIPGSASEELVQEEALNIALICTALEKFFCKPPRQRVTEPTEGNPS